MMADYRETVEKLKTMALELRAMVANDPAFNRQRNMLTAKLLEAAMTEAEALLTKQADELATLRAENAELRAYADNKDKELARAYALAQETTP